MSSISKRKLLLEKMRKEKGLAAKIKNTITPRKIDGNPMSSIQKRFWFLYKSDPLSSAYNISVSINLDGKLDISIFNKAINSVINRHDILRAAYHDTKEGSVEQLISDKLEINLEIIDTLNKEQEKEEIQREATTPFNLEKGPLIRVKLLTLSENKHNFLLSMHHIISEDVSFELFLKEISCFMNDNENMLPILGIQYQDYALWQNNYILSNEIDKQLQYWKNNINNDNSFLPFPTDFTRPAIQTFSGKIEAIEIDESIVKKAKEVCHANGVTLFMFFASIYNILLSRFSNQQTLNIGIPVSGRNYEELNPLIGCFVNTLILKTTVDDDLTLPEYLLNVKKNLLNAYLNKDVPLDKVIESIELDRNISYNPLFQFMFTFQDNSNDSWKSALDIPFVKSFPKVIHNGSSKVDQTMLIENTGHGLHIEIEYNTDLFTADSIINVLNCYSNLLEDAVNNPEIKINNLNLLSEVEKNDLVNFDDTEISYFDTIPDSFVDVAKLYPDNTAIEFENRIYSYKEVEQKSNKLSQILIAKGIKANKIVAICLERSPEFVIAVLSVLRAGGAYLPIDPSTPEDRVNYILNDAKTSVFITQTSLEFNSLNTDIPLIDMESDWADSKIDLNNTILPSVSPDDIAYVIYTSGSTGKPKGVIVKHNALSNLINWHIRSYNITHESRATMLAGLAFDACVWEIWPYLTMGASLYIATEEIRLSANKILEWYVNKKITTSFLPTPLAEAVLMEQIPDGLVLESLLTGGDKLHFSPSKNIPFTVYNHYGPTENTVVTTVATISADDTDAAPLIGSPIDNTRVYVLDSKQRLLPVGIIGELYISGISLAHGYLNHDELTQEYFLSNPFGKGIYSKMYRTGDLVRYKSNGMLEFIGRADSQVKIRGLRIELGEIEATLSSERSIKQCVVLVHGNDSSDKYITAYYIYKDNQKSDVEALRDHLLKALPEYMIPKYFLEVDEFILTNNGKIDYKLLPIPNDSNLTRTTHFVAASSDVQKDIVKIWSDVLSVTNVGIYDDFFSIGGHSLLAMQVVSLIKNKYQIELPLRVIFEHASVAELSKFIENEINSNITLDKISIPNYTLDRDIQLSFAQQRLWYLDQLEPGNPVYNIPIVYQLTGNLNVENLIESLKIIFERHDAFKTYFQIKDGFPIQVVDNNLFPEIECINLNQLDENELNAYLSKKSSETFLLSHSPLIRMSVIQHSNNYLLFIVAHHSVFDGWSAQIFMNELSVLYDNSSSPSLKKLPSLSLQYTDYSMWQRDWLKDDVLNQKLEYWKTHLHGILPTLELPSDFVRPNVFTYKGKTLSVEMPAEIFDGINELSRNNGVTPFMLSFAVYITLLFRYTGQTDIVTGTFIANRNQEEIQNIIGYFTNTLALRTTFDEEITFSELLLLVRKTCLNAYSHQELPFEKLVEELNPARELSHTPIFQSIFSYEKFSDLELPLGDISVKRLNVDSKVARTDLSFTLQESFDGKKCSIVVEYCDDIFKKETMLRCIDHYLNLMKSIVQSPDAKLYDLPMLTDDDYKLIKSNNDTNYSFQDDKCIHEIISEKSRLNPEKIAISFNGNDVSYAQLELRSNNLSTYLKSLEVNKNELIALCVNRSEDMLIAMIAILKTGAAYLPIDPNYPTSRIEFILEDANVSIIVTESNIQDTIPIQDEKVILLDKEWEPQFPQNESENDVVYSADNLAYSIYTSGSTGKPKGVLVPHKTVVNFLSSMAEKPGLNVDDVLLAVTTLSFDIAVLELFLPLFVGAKVEISDKETSSDGGLLLDKILHSNVTLMQATPATWKLLISSGWDQSTALKVLCGGETLTPELARELTQRSNNIWNMYGPTETTVWSTIYQVNDPHQEVLIGKPIANTKIHILDKHKKLLPIGIAGELYIGGAGVTNGYLNRNDLTRERFIKLSINDEDEEIFYRTGDLVNYKSDGNVNYINRLDNQVKVRGFRIELGEIENVLLDYDGISQVVVITREDIPGDIRLVAYFVAVNQDEVSVASIRKHLRTSLPDYMVPQHFIEIDDVPVTPNGKVNRLDLPLPLDVTQSSNNYVAPNTENEKMLADIWKEVLAVKQVSVNDNFFEIGGHSLLTVQVIAKVQKKTGIKLELRPMIMDNLGQIAAQCSNAEHKKDSKSLMHKIINKIKTAF